MSFGDRVIQVGKVRGGALNAFFWALIALAALLLCAFFGVRLFGLTPYAVLSGSMEPEYPVGSMIYVKAVDPEDVEVGDAITFSLESGTLVTHQVYQIDAESREFRTQGIANIKSDGSISPDAAPVRFDSLVGKPVACIPYLGYVNKFLTSQLGIIVVGTVVAVFVIVSIALDRLAAVDEGRRSPSCRGGGGKHRRRA